MRFGANAFDNFECALEKAIENWAGRALFMRGFVGVAHLAEDFGFAQEHGVEPGRNAEEMAHGVAIVVMIERADEDFAADRVKFAEEGCESIEAILCAFGRDAVDFAAIAGGEDERFVKNAAGAEFVGGATRLVRGERHTFAHFNGRGAVI